MINVNAAEQTTKAAAIWTAARFQLRWLEARAMCRDAAFPKFATL